MGDIISELIFGWLFLTLVLDSPIKFTLSRLPWSGDDYDVHVAHVKYLAMQMVDSRSGQLILRDTVANLILHNNADFTLEQSCCRTIKSARQSSTLQSSPCRKAFLMNNATYKTRIVVVIFLITTLVTAIIMIVYIDNI